MAIKKAVGRPTKVNMRTVIKLADLIQHNYNISDACKHSGISRETYYRYLNSEELFAEMMATAHDNQNKAVFNFMTVA
jgi:ACT domain-containing protein